MIENKYSKKDNSKEAEEKTRVMIINEYMMAKNTLVDCLKQHRDAMELTKVNGKEEYVVVRKFDDVIGDILVGVNDTLKKMKEYGFPKEELEKYEKEINEICDTDAKNETVNYENRVPSKEYLENQSKASMKKTTEKESRVNQKKEPKKQTATRKEEKKNVESVNRPVANKKVSDDAYIAAMRAKGDYDFVPLPSHGECYPCKKNNIEVELVKAKDENIITSPVLYNENRICEVLVGRKVCDLDIKAEDLCSGDMDAVTLFLRKTSYGSDFPITVTDDKGDSTFETTINLDDIKYKEFKLKGDENGWFPFKLPISGDEVRFKYLSLKEERELFKRNEADELTMTTSLIIKKLDEVDRLVEKIPQMDDELKERLTDSLEDLKEYLNADSSEDAVGLYENTVTNTLEAYVMSVNGNTDKNFIAEYVSEIKAMDALKLRRYIGENRPGVDFRVTVQKPESLGGGSMETFLNWDDSVFWNIP